MIFGSDKTLGIRTEIAHNIVGMSAPVVELRLIKTPVYFFSEEATCFYSYADIDLSWINIESFIELLLSEPVGAAATDRHKQEIENSSFSSPGFL